jgi:hypothetical protein
MFSLETRTRILLCSVAWVAIVVRDLGREKLNKPCNQSLAAVFFLSISFALVSSTLGFASATNIYITPNGASQGACTTSPQTPAWFNNSANWGSSSGQIGPGTTVTICGIFNGAAGSTEFTFQGSGLSGSPITLLFDTNAQLTSPYWAPSPNGGCGGAICIYNRSYIIINGGSSGVIQNGSNGDTLVYQQPSEAIEAFGCNNCTVENLTIANIYVHTAGGNSTIDQTRMRCLSMSGSNWMVKNNTMHDAGWCLFQGYANGDTNTVISGNNIYNMDHGWMLAPNGAYGFTNAVFYNNQVHDTANWDASGCPYHHDGIHTFGTTGSSMSGIYVYNNYFYGNWGTCPTGFVFVEAGGGGTPSNMETSAWWNNVFLVGGASPIVNTNGWVDIASGVSGTQRFFNNTVIGSNAVDNTLCVGLEYLSSLTYENNTISGCGDPMSMISTTIASADYNFYGPPSCQNLHNCFDWNGSFTGTFAAWQTACSCDAHSIQGSAPLLNANGSPEAGSPVIGKAVNLTPAATGILVSLTSDTTLGGTRTPGIRPATGAWDIGAYESKVPNPPTGLGATVK